MHGAVFTVQKVTFLPKSMAVLVTGCTPDVCYCNRSSINIPMLTRKLSIVCLPCSEVTRAIY